MNENPYQPPKEQGGKPRRRSRLAGCLIALVGMFIGAIVGGLGTVIVAEMYWSVTPTPRGIAEDEIARGFMASSLLVLGGILGGIAGAVMGVWIVRRSKR